MRSRSLALVLVLLLAIPAAASARMLKRGMHGPRVKVVQRALHLRADGVFGPATKRAVIRFQRRRGLTADGIVGPATWKALTAPRAARGRRGAVMVLQRALRIRADGIFGPGTDAAVRRFQRRHGLTADGIVGPATWAALGRRGPTLRQTLFPGGPGGRPPAVGRVIRAANRIATKPYRYGGGHRRFRDSGYDCSGSVSFALHGAGLLASPLPSGAFRRWGAPGPGRWITIYANRGHMYMVVAGRRFDTSGLSERGTRWTRERRDPAGFVVRHPPGL
jgi:peptidoglycan hydrolase-like protein with peptidoglycan-binding domain